jgi:C4-dicarboxylate-specific signal transduction histidine kinase
MRSFNTMNRPALEPVPLGAFLDRFTAMVQKDVRGRGVALEVVKDERAGAVLADPQALHQVMLNLITNALDALEDRTAPRIRVEARRGVSHVRIIVSDNGRGIPAQMRARIFQPFHTTKPRGTGLGLTITRKLVTLMRGTIELDGAEGSGARFTITLDAADAPDSERRTPTLWPPAVTGDTHPRGDR